VGLLFWDASALVKRYTVEVGRDTVNAVFASVPHRDMATTAWGYAETYSVLLRRLNGGTIDLPTFTAAITALQAEIVASPDFMLLPIDDSVIFASISLLRKHNLNAADAAVLTTLLQFLTTSPASVPACVVASDQRLIRAANVEGLKVLNPETLAVADVPSFLASL
jgi:predicted nucleic acid-binding protein